ncbi:MAG: energy-coupling factor transporter ATPase [Erysipelotrichaceae bacterium]|nr:energy-coupling factor transporter ATPase [Erysipelotrichaceae bacterium]
MSIRFEKVDHEYSPKTPFAFLALQDIDLEFTEGKITAVIGATGSGKTTLVQHLNGLLLPSKGSVTVGEHTIKASEKLKNVKDLRKNVGLVFQFAEYQLFEETVLKDVAFGPQNFGVDELTANEAAKRALKTVGIDEADFEKSPLELSGGQKRRVAIAGILAMQPRLLVLDEPTAGLDPQGAKSMMELFRSVNKKSGITIIIVTHNMEHVLEYCDETVILEKGRVIFHDTAREFFENPQYMERARIDAPNIIRFRELCRERGLDISRDTLSIEDLARQIAARRKKK